MYRDQKGDPLRTTSGSSLLFIKGVCRNDPHAVVVNWLRVVRGNTGNGWIVREEPLDHQQTTPWCPRCGILR
jgi:hypothetical protein